jgi:hypothetical protein
MAGVGGFLRRTSLRPPLGSGVLKQGALPSPPAQEAACANSVGCCDGENSAQLHRADIWSEYVFNLEGSAMRVKSKHIAAVLVLAASHAQAATVSVRGGSIDVSPHITHSERGPTDALFEAVTYPDFNAFDTERSFASADLRTGTLRAHARSGNDRAITPVAQAALGDRITITGTGARRRPRAWRNSS